MEKEKVLVTGIFLFSRNTFPVGEINTEYFEAIINCNVMRLFPDRIVGFFFQISEKV